METRFIYERWWNAKLDILCLLKEGEWSVLLIKELVFIKREIGWLINLINQSGGYGGDWSLFKGRECLKVLNIIIDCKLTQNRGGGAWRGMNQFIAVTLGAVSFAAWN
jgi:hypothetical protein